MAITPRELKKLYWELEVYMIPSDAPKDDPRMEPTNSQLPPGEWRKTKVASYRLGKTGTYKDDFWREVHKNIDEKNEGIQVVVKTIGGQVETKMFRNANQLAYCATAPFWGKGSPEQVQIMLQLRYRFQKVKFGLDDFTKAEFIGLDCNGFVGCYIQRCWHGEHWYQPKQKDLDSGTWLETLFNYGAPVKTMEEMLRYPSATFMLARTTISGGIMDRVPLADGTTDYGHIMITQPGEMYTNADKTITMPVVESTGVHGLVESKYIFSPPDKRGVWKVKRGVKNNATMEVRVSRLC
jgi:hypothetical protein